jgi:hypothetical protein
MYVRNISARITWATTTHMNVWTHLSMEWKGKTGIGLYPDGMSSVPPAASKE